MKWSGSGTPGAFDRAYEHRAATHLHLVISSQTMNRLITTPRSHSVATHLGAALLGCLAFWGIRSTKGHLETDPPATHRWKSVDRSSRTSDPAGTLLLQEMTKNVPIPMAGGTGISSVEQQNAHADSLPLAADVRAAAISWLSSYREEYGPEEFLEMQSRLLHWMRDDPQGMIEYVYSLPKPQPYGNSSYLMAQILDAAVQRSGVAVALEWMRRNPNFAENTAEQMAPHFGATGDLNNLEAFRNQVGSAWNDVRDNALKAWPAEKSDELIGFLEESPDLLIHYATMKNDEGAEWLLKLLTSDRLNEPTRQALAEDYQFRNLLIVSSKISPELRVREIMRSNPDQSEGEIRRQIVANDVMVALNSGSDLRYSFRYGKISAEEVFQDVSSRLPALAGDSSVALRRQVYQELAEENSQAAMSLLKDLSSEQRQDAISQAPLEMFGDLDPQRLYDFLQTIPTTDNDAAWEKRLQSWEARTDRNQERLGNDYITWVKNLPAGTDREMAIFGLIANDSDPLPPAESQDLIQEIRAPKLLSRLDELLEKRKEEGQ